jgi:mannosyltransferase OCH1-like enzyme
VWTSALSQSATKTSRRYMITDSQAFERELFFQGVEKQTITIGKPTTDNPPTKTIPLVIFQTFKSRNVPVGQFNATNSIRCQNTAAAYTFYDDAEAEKFLAENCVPAVLEAFQRVVPGAFKADIFRLAVLAVKGGIYTDASMCVDRVGATTFEQLLEQLPPGVENVLVRDLGRSGRGIYQAFLMCAPGSTLFAHILQAITKQVNDKYIPKNLKRNNLSITGPVAFAKFLREYWHQDEKTPIQLGQQKHDASTFVLKFEQHVLSNTGYVLDVKGHKMLRTKYTNWKKDRKKSNAPHYNQLLAKKKLYNF